MPRLFQLTIIVITLLFSPASAAWRGEIVEADGIPLVSNPESPAEGEVDIRLEKLWEVGGDDEDILFGVISQLIQDDEGNIYLLDSQLSEIQVFSPDGEFLRTIGGEGEGPGEFRGGFDMFQGPDGRVGVVQIFPGKIIQLETDGTPAPLYPVPEVDGGGFQIIYRARGGPQGVMISGAYQQGRGEEAKQITYLKSFDLSGREIAHFHGETNSTRFGGMQFQEQTFSNFTTRWAVADDGRVACALDFDKYELHVFNPDGSIDRVIRRPEFEPVPRSDREKQRFQKLYDGITRWNPGSSFEISKTHLSADRMQFREDGTLWVLPSSGIWATGDGVFASFDVYDREGRFNRRVNLLAEGDPKDDALFFVGDRVYIVTDLFSAQLANLGGDEGEEELEEEPEPVSVIAYEMTMP